MCQITFCFPVEVFLKATDIALGLWLMAFCRNKIATRKTYTTSKLWRYVVRFSHRARKYLFRVCIHRSGWEVTGQNRRKWNCNREKGRGNIGWAEFHPNCFTGTYPWVQWLWNPFNVDWAIATAPEVKNQGKKGSEKFEQRLSLQFHYQIE